MANLVNKSDFEPTKYIQCKTLMNRHRYGVFIVSVLEEIDCVIAYK